MYYPSRKNRGSNVGSYHISQCGAGDVPYRRRRKLRLHICTVRILLHNSNFGIDGIFERLEHQIINAAAKAAHMEILSPTECKLKIALPKISLGSSIEDTAVNITIGRLI